MHGGEGVAARTLALRRARGDNWRREEPASLDGIGKT